MTHCEAIQVGGPCLLRWGHSFVTPLPALSVQRAFAPRLVAVARTAYFIRPKVPGVSKGTLSLMTQL